MNIYPAWTGTINNSIYPDWLAALGGAISHFALYAHGILYYKLKC